MQLKLEVEFFGDIVIVPYMDSYDLVVLKTVAICEYGVSKTCLLDVKINCWSFNHNCKFVGDNYTSFVLCKNRFEQYPLNIL